MQIGKTNRSAPVTAGLLLGACLFATVAPAQSPPAANLPTWTMARADSGSSGAIGRNLPSQLTLLWEAETAEAIESTPVSDGVNVYVADVMGGVEALDLASGESRWRREFETGFEASPGLFLPESIDANAAESTAQIPVIEAASGNPAEDSAAADAAVRAILVVSDVYGNIVALDPSTGESVWKYATEGQISAAPTFFAVPRGDAYEVRVLQSSQDGNLYCLSAADGALVWKYETGDQIRCSASIAAGKTFLGGCDGQLHVIDLATGEPAREPLPLGGPTGSTPAVSGDEVFLPVMAGTLFAFHPSTGDVRWEFEDPDRPDEFRSSVAIGADRIVVSSQNKHVDAIERASGERIWRKTLRRRADASPLIAGDDVWIASTAGLLLRLSLADGDEKWSFESRGKFMAAPAVVGDRLIIADDDGVVRCFGPS
ncbi:outer membrane protein assembly factor BamB family protein [Allorhodopirellula solitaria]|uniref:Serine/threonine-protein kinase AfsK n=1 Tax=Allorhodopirellula solitaria TaxID=2527987 RepID=A0A5C5XYC8_9BACT|nr:PQQ-binding-like beta-propeller repeat protein [Allorhodopirellula solitaria]TWT67531.1 Serine/threonine-protein kinase AfsK [Allorhodopirellula solitaria]